jgi:hypothetical protein
MMFNNVTVIISTYKPGIFLSHLYVCINYQNTMYNFIIPVQNSLLTHADMKIQC